MHKRGKAAAATALSVSGLVHPVEIRRHPGARRLTLRVNQTSHAVVVTVPERCKIDEAGRFVHRNLEWVRERLGNLPGRVAFSNGATIPFRGEQHQLRFSGPRRSGAVVEIKRQADGLLVLDVKGELEHAPRRLRAWLIEQARRDLADRVTVHTKRLGLTAGRITVRDQSSRWGSCSSSGALAFSWRLILSPPMVLDYVAAHEVAHLAEMNHGKRFWALVAKTFPEVDAARRWLRTNGNDLHRYGHAPGASPDSAA